MARRSGWLPRSLWPLGAVALLGAVSCRDATSPFEAVDRPDDTGMVPRQITFSAGDDRSPAWDPSGEAILYATPGFSPFGEAPGVLLRVPSGGGAAAEVFPRLQFPGGPEDWFASPAPRGGVVAWMDLWAVRGENFCPGTTIMCVPEGETDGTAPPLAEIRLRVRTPEGGPEEGDPELRVSIEGVTVPDPAVQRFVVEMHPFQELFHAEGSAVFRPSWSPAGDQLVFSDGLRLLIWTIGSVEAVAIPGTDDGVQAAWSPDGEWIAFTRLVRGAARLFECQHLTLLGPVCSQDRIEYPITDRIVTLVRPDGSDLVALSRGDDPAWTPDSDRLVFREGGRLWMIGRDGSGLTDLPDTEGGREPAVSPDGTELAFARLDPGSMTHDVIVVGLGRSP